MARQKGTANFSGTLEVLAGGPIDSRTVVPTLADLTIASNFPYAYVGLETYVISENKKYRLIAADVTQLDNWEEVGSGGDIDVDDALSSTSENPVQNKVIKAALDDKVNKVAGKGLSTNDYTTEEKNKLASIKDYTAGDGIDITDHEISADPMPSADMDEVISPLPSVMSRRFKYSTEEQIVGEWIDGKPVYQKTFSFSNLPNSIGQIDTFDISGLHIKNVIAVNGYAITMIPSIQRLVCYPIPFYVPTESGYSCCALSFYSADGDPIGEIIHSVLTLYYNNASTWNGVFSIVYTKTTD